MDRLSLQDLIARRKAEKEWGVNYYKPTHADLEWLDNNNYEYSWVVKPNDREEEPDFEVISISWDLEKG